MTVSITSRSISRVARTGPFFCPLHAAHALYLPGFLGMEDVQIPCAVLQRFILIDPQFISCFSDLKYFTVIFFVKQGSKFAVCIDCNGVKRCLKGISLSCFCYANGVFTTDPLTGRST